MGRGTVLVKGHNGLGNRLLSLATAHYFALLSDRHLVVDWRDWVYAADGRDQFRLLFASPDATSIETVNPEFLSHGSIAPPCWIDHHDDDVVTRLRNLRQGAHSAPQDPVLWKRSSVDLSRLDHPQDTVVLWMNFERLQPLRRHFRGGFAALARQNDRALLRSWLRERLTPQPALAQRVEAFRRERLEGPAVGIHVRYTDKKANLLRLQKRLDALISRQGERPIFLATDSQEVLDLFRNRYRRLEALPKRYSRDGNRLHYSNLAANQCRRDAEDAVVDLYLLVGCEELVYDEASSFGYVASLLTAAADRHQHNIYPLRHWPRPLRQQLFQWLRQVELLRGRHG